MRATQQEDPRGHHRGRVDERRDRGRALHGVGQPEMQRDLRALAHRRDQEQERDRGGGTPGHEVGPETQRRVVEGAVRGEDQEHGQEEPDVTHPVGDEGLLAGDGGGVALEPERDEEVGAQTHALPTEEGHQEARAQDQDDHREREQVEVREEAAEPLVSVHVPDRVEVDQRAHAGHQEDPGDRERIDEEAHVDLQRAGGQPGVEGADVDPRVAREDPAWRRTSRTTTRTPGP